MFGITVRGFKVHVWYHGSKIDIDMFELFWVELILLSEMILTWS